MNTLNSSTKPNFFYSWPIIVLALIVFWPIGLFLIYKRMNSDKNSTLKTSKVLYVISIFSFLVSFAGIITIVENGILLSDILILIFFLSAGIISYLYARKLSSDAVKYKKYFSIIINDNILSLNKISDIMNKSITDVIADINLMISKGFLENAYINESDFEIVLPPSLDSAENDTIVVQCNCCGAKNVISNKTTKCIYCDSHLS